LEGILGGFCLSLFHGNVTSAPFLMYEVDQTPSVGNVGNKFLNNVM
jgi:hypothetical protein